MQSSKSDQRILRFVMVVLGIALFTALLKALFAFLGNQYLYTMPILGGFLQSLELVELSNFLIFAILGFGVGAITGTLPQRLRERLGLIVLLILIPLVFSTSYLARHHLWVNRVAQEAQLSRSQAQEVTNVFLEAKSGHEGFLGYYLYTARIPLLPTSASEMQDLAASEAKMRSELTELSGIESDWFSMAFDVAGWGLRGFYFFVALITASLYFYKGLDRAQLAQRKRRYQSAPAAYSHAHTDRQS